MYRQKTVTTEPWRWYNAKQRGAGSMQQGRLFEILYLLVEKRHITVKELAERFAVSARTIYRDRADGRFRTGLPSWERMAASCAATLIKNAGMRKRPPTRADVFGWFNGKQAYRPYGVRTENRPSKCGRTGPPTVRIPGIVRRWPTVGTRHPVPLCRRGKQA